MERFADWQGCQVFYGRSQSAGVDLIARRMAWSVPVSAEIDAATRSPRPAPKIGQPCHKTPGDRNDTSTDVFSTPSSSVLFVLSLWKLSVARTKRSWKKFLAIPFCKRNPNITSLKNLKHTHIYIYIHILAPLKPIFLTFWLVFTVFLVYFAINTKPYMLNWFSGSLTLVSDDVSDMCRCKAIFAWYLLYFWTLHCDLWYLYIYIYLYQYK